MRARAPPIQELDHDANPPLPNPHTCRRSIPVSPNLSSEIFNEFSLIPLHLSDLHRETLARPCYRPARRRTTRHQLHPSSMPGPTPSLRPLFRPARSPHLKLTKR